ncbi:organic hydroperoxide reductase OsmC/OhrA [Ancylobacter sp. 3268]|uniref:OsmC family protein n=1 Tax=Ancylobacter sp. 3268 TaxID=2817752 RepID=UPI002867579A|nr:OsmC family protein [Ancylobacter sp. 3268]MDR6952417.1 organic hydroperoxide reductase OsmC/OhrA [Ancylobacter sp. 3268]
MATTHVDLRSVPGTQATTGWAGGHTVTVDRAMGVAGGAGLGFNGGQLLALAIGGCFCNDLHYTAHAMGVILTEVSVSVEVDFIDDPPMATGARITAQASALPRDVDIEDLINRAFAVSTVGNSLRQGVNVELAAA